VDDVLNEIDPSPKECFPEWSSVWFQQVHFPIEPLVGWFNSIYIGSWERLDSLLSVNSLSSRTSPETEITRDCFLSRSGTESARKKSYSARFFQLLWQANPKLPGLTFLAGNETISRSDTNQAMVKRHWHLIWINLVEGDQLRIETSAKDSFALGRVATAARSGAFNSRSPTLKQERLKSRCLPPKRRTGTPILSSTPAT